MGDTILYFGCRKRDEDYLYHEELENYVNKGSLTLHVAFSREQKEKVYVTHLLANHADEIWKVIGENNGHLYVCGFVITQSPIIFEPNFVCFFRDARNMARDVHNLVLKVIIEKGNMTEQQAVAYLKKMEAQKRYSVDVWS